MWSRPVRRESPGSGRKMSASERGRRGTKCPPGQPGQQQVVRRLWRHLPKYRRVFREIQDKKPVILEEIGEKIASGNVRSEEFPPSVHHLAKFEKDRISPG